MSERIAPMKAPGNAPDALIVVHGAPELSCVPQAFWKRMAAYIRDGHTGEVCWHFKNGKPMVIKATDTLRNDKEGLISP